LAGRSAWAMACRSIAITGSACTGLGSTLKRLPNAMARSCRSPTSSIDRSTRSAVHAGPTSRSPLRRSARAARSQGSAWVGNRCEASRRKWTYRGALPFPVAGHYRALSAL
jgi:hypothetical protein